MNAYLKIIESLYLNDSKKLNDSIEQFKNQKLVIANSEEGAGKLFSAFIRIVNNQWIDGWTIIYENFKPLLLSRKEGEFPILWTMAVTNGNLKVLEDLEALGYISRYRDDSQKTTIHILFDTVGIHKIHTPSNAQIKNIIDFISDKLDLYEAYPGFFEKGDVLKNGNAFWSYAIKQDNWSLAEYTLPHSWEDMIKTKRWDEAVIYLQETFKKIGNKNKEIQNLWEKMLYSFIDNKNFQKYLNITDLHDLEQLIPLFKNRNRDFLWEVMSKKNQYGRTFWHQLIGQPTQEIFYNVIDYAIQDNININEIVTLQDSETERPIDSYIMYWEYINKELSIRDKEYFNRLVLSLKDKDLNFTSDLISVSVGEKLKNLK